MIYIASPGDSTIKSINTASLGTATSTTIASGFKFSGISLDTASSSTSPTWYTTTTTGNIVALTPSGTVTDTGIKTGTATDGFVGVLSSPGTTAVSAAAAPYLVQGQTGNFWNATPSSIPVPYSIACTASGTSVCDWNGPAGNTLIAKNSIFNTAATVQTAIKANADTLGTGGTAPSTAQSQSGFGIAYIPGPSTQAATNVLTPSAFIFADCNGTTNSLRTLVP